MAEKTRVRNKPIQKRLLDEAGAVSLLYLIDEKGEITGNDVRELRGSYTRWMDLCRRFAKFGLITIEFRQVPFRRYTIKITAKGRETADLYREIEAYINP
jgi:DNA-binding MarR family transcriptional regulator